MMQGSKTWKRYAENIEKRIKRLKMSKVEVIEGAGQGSEERKRRFRYIVMQLPADRVTEEKLEEMRQKSSWVKNVLKVEVATREDIPRLCDLYNTSFFQCPDPYRPISIEDMTEIFNRSTILLGRMYGMDAGFIVLKEEVQEGDNGENLNIGVICGIAVHPQHRQKGIATAIGLRAYEYFSGKNIDAFQCEVYEENKPSIAFITWLGFRPVGELIIEAPSAASINPLDRI